MLKIENIEKIDAGTLFYEGENHYYITEKAGYFELIAETLSGNVTKCVCSSLASAFETIAEMEAETV